jgi:hypothetical protein
MTNEERDLTLRAVREALADTRKAREYLERGRAEVQRRYCRNSPGDKSFSAACARLSDVQHTLAFFADYTEHHQTGDKQND